MRRFGGSDGLRDRRVLKPVAALVSTGKEAFWKADGDTPRPILTLHGDSLGGGAPTQIFVCGKRKFDARFSIHTVAF